MRILLVAHNILRGDGQGRINYEIVKRALATDNQVTMLADAVADDLVAGAAKWIEVHPPLRRPNMLKVWGFLRAANPLVRELRQKHDVVVGNGFVLTEPHDVNLCQFVHGAWGRSPVHVSRLRRGCYSWYQRLYTSLNTSGEIRSFNAAQFVVAPSHKIVRDLQSIGLPAAKTRVIFNGVDPSEFNAERVDRTSVGLWPDGVLAVFVGDIRTPRKNLDTVLSALVNVPDLRLAVVGALENSPFPDMAKKLGIENRVLFLGYRRDVHDIMRACDFFVFPSRYEAGALVILEAMACGLPVISADSAGGAELIGEGGTVLADSEDHAALTAAMKLLATDQKVRASQSRAARRIAEQHSWVQMADEYLSLFNECANEDSSRKPQLRYPHKPAVVC